MKKKGFTLIELLAVIVILALTFLFVIPEINNLIQKGEDTNKDLVEEKIIVATKEYILNYDDNFYSEMINVGDVNYVYKNDLLNNHLITEEDISKVDNFIRVRCELLEDNKLKYVVEYD